MRLLHLWAAWSLAVAGPVLDLLGDHERFFVARGASPAGVVLFALGLSLVPPLALFGVVALVSRASARAGALLLAALVGVLGGAFLVPALDAIPGLPDAVVILAAALLAGGIAGLYATRAGVRSFVTVLGAAPLVFLGVFLFASPVSDFVFGSSEARGAGAARTPVVLVVFDELPLPSLTEDRDRIDARRFPAFGALAREATWYPEASSVSGSTLTAVPAILDGRDPRPDSLPDAADHPDSLFTLLGSSHRIVRAEPLTDLCPERLCPGGRRPGKLAALAGDAGQVALHLVAPRGLRGRLPSLDPDARRYVRGVAGNVHIPRALFDDRVAKVDAALGRLAASADPERPALAVLHAVLPHEPWTLLPDGREYPVSGDSIVGLRDDVLAGDPELSRQALQRHLLQLGYVDRALGEIRARLRASGLWDRALVVVTADHGAGFAPGENRRRVTPRNAAELAAVPFFVKRPGQRRGAVDRHPVRTVDVVPTIAQALGARVPWRADGRPVGMRPGGEGIRIAGPERPGGADVTVSLSRAAFRRDRAAAGARVRRWFGAGSWRGVYASGSRPDLLGRRAPRTRAPARPGATVEGATGLTAVRRDSGVLPAYVTGAVRDGGRAPLALAVDGRVVATTRPYRDSGELRWSAVLPPSSLREGANDLAVLRPRGRRLVVLARAGARGGFALRGGLGDPVLLRAGRAVRAEPGPLAGELDQAEVSDRVVRMGGWAADTGPGGRPARAVAVFAGARLLWAGVPTKRRPDVTGAWHAGVLRSGFRFTAARDDLRHRAIRAFALGPRGAVPLPLTGQAAAVLPGVTGPPHLLVPFGDGRATGRVAAAVARRRTLALTGWARSGGRPAGTVLAVRGGRVLALAPTGRPWPGSGRAGFRLEIPRRDLRGGGRLSLLAVGPRGATELAIGPGARRVLDEAQR